MRRLKYALLVLVCMGSVKVSAQKEGYISSLTRQNHWVDSVYKKLNRKKKIAQLFFVRAQLTISW